MDSKVPQQGISLNGPQDMPCHKRLSPPNPDQIAKTDFGFKLQELDMK